MFGHWYASEKLMDEMENSLKLYNLSIKENPLNFPVEVAVFLDETSYSKVGTSYQMPIPPNTLRDILAKCGIPYNVYLIEDFDNLVNNGFEFKSVIFAVPFKSQKIQEAVDFCKVNNVGCLCAGEGKELYAIEDFENLFDNSGVWRYTKENDIFYIGNGFFAIHAVNEGIKTVTFPKDVKIIPLNYDSNEQVCSEFDIKMQRFESQIYKIEKV